MVINLYTNPTLPGMSGGPVLDKKGGLVGIHGQAEIDTTMTQSEGIAVKLELIKQYP